MTAAWRGFGFDKGDGYSELRLGFIGFAVVKGTLWQEHKDLQIRAKQMNQLNDQLIKVLNKHGLYLKG
ncbi:hypothetical protein [Commensalibacter communis]|nr:hypothetical protein [Commensalibacter communis]